MNKNMNKKVFAHFAKQAIKRCAAISVGIVAGVTVSTPMVLNACAVDSSHNMDSVVQYVEERAMENQSAVPGTLDFYRNISFINVYEPDELTEEILSNRNGEILIEKTIGIVEDDELNGRILNTEDKEYDYISYDSVKDVQAGDVVMTYFVYNPDSNYSDDILERHDYIIDRGVDVNAEF